MRYRVTPTRGKVHRAKKGTFSRTDRRTRASTGRHGTPLHGLVCPETKPGGSATGAAPKVTRWNQGVSPCPAERRAARSSIRGP